MIFVGIAPSVVLKAKIPWSYTKKDIWLQIDKIIVEDPDESDSKRSDPGVS